MSDTEQIVWEKNRGGTVTPDPVLHAATHMSEASDEIGIDQLGAATDSTTLDVSTTAHGLCPKAPDDTDQFLRGDATWAALPTSCMGEISFYGNSTATTVTTTQTWTKITITTANNVAMDYDNPSAGTLRYTGTATRVMHCGCTISSKPVGANDTFKYVLVKNGTWDGNNENTGGTVLSQGTITLSQRTNTVTYSTAIHVMVSMATNDTLELAVWNDTSAQDITVIDMNLFAVGMGN